MRSPTPLPHSVSYNSLSLSLSLCVLHLFLPLSLFVHSLPSLSNHIFSLFYSLHVLALWTSPPHHLQSTEEAATSPHYPHETLPRLVLINFDDLFEDLGLSISACSMRKIVFVG
ncbi:hypothetical protein RchiOBHm_Chr7g0181411 [Rosa chinensis]|uniref:Uncharacterized protein n=1 Tax=Rosa chinensis TaxID=74649 RepID=A0A2P6P2N3_ROSCH|nr:hypothetical protein RchiOBHm_Chr7g0181411 [Rosa chinensis]